MLSIVDQSPLDIMILKTHNGEKPTPSLQEWFYWIKTPITGTPLILTPLKMVLLDQDPPHFDPPHWEPLKMITLDRIKSSLTLTPTHFNSPSKLFYWIKTPLTLTPLKMILLDRIKKSSLTPRCFLPAGFPVKAGTSLSKSFFLALFSCKVFFQQNLY